MNVLFTIGLFAERGDYVKRKSATVTVLRLQRSVHSIELFGHSSQEREEIQSNKKTT